MPITAKSSHEAIMEVVNRQNGTTLDGNDVTVENMRFAPETPADATIDLVAVEDGAFTGTVSVTYKRQPIEFIVSSLGPLEIDYADREDDAMVDSATRFGWLDNSPVPWDRNLDLEVDVKTQTVKIIVTNHWVAYGETTVKYTLKKQELSEVVHTTTLNAFTEEDVTAPTVDIPLG